jgi:hypothetical protein
LVLLAAVSTCAIAAAEEKCGKKSDKKCDKAVAVFNGKDLSGWKCHLVDESVKMEDVWSVEDGVLVCKGEPLGYLHTEDEFKDFKLVIEWRWAPGGEPGNSGVLLRIQGEPQGFLAKCVEAQLKHGSAGDVWAFYGAKVEGAEDRFKKIEHHAALGDFAGVGKIKDAERDPGKWNRYEITFRGEKLTLKINGEEVNEAEGCDVVAGPIGLQSEGGEIHFRRVELVPLGK